MEAYCLSLTGRKATPSSQEYSFAGVLSPKHSKHRGSALGPVYGVSSGRISPEVASHFDGHVHCSIVLSPRLHSYDTMCS